MPLPVDLVVAGLVRAEDGVWRRGEVGVQDGVVSYIGTASAQAEARRRIDVGDAYVLPGMVDGHVHCLSHPGEGILAATRAAAAGGVTTVVEMPFDAAGPINSVERLSAKRDLVEAEAIVDMALLATLAPGGGWKAASELAAGGACGFKVSLFDTDPQRFPRIDDAELLSVFHAVAETGRVVCVHAENNEIVMRLINLYRAAGETKPGDHARSRPPVSETQGVLTALEAAWYSGNKLHLCHLSLPRAVDLVRQWHGSGADVSVETCPHYLLLTDLDVADQGSRLKINPPLRDEESRDGLWERVTRREIDVIGSDHAPWPLEYKTKDSIFDCHSGVPGVETIYPLILAAALERGQATFEAAVDAMTIGPARRFGLNSRKGRLIAGHDADIAVFDPRREWRIDESMMRSNAGWSPYHGRTNAGEITLTVVRGEVVYDGSVCGVPGSGQVVAP